MNNNLFSTSVRNTVSGFSNGRGPVPSGPRQADAITVSRGPVPSGPRQADAMPVSRGPVPSGPRNK